MSTNIKKWIHGDSLGSGSSGTVNIATPTKGSTKLPSPTAVKSLLFLTSYSLKHEENMLDHLGSSSYIVKCYGHNHTKENQKVIFNIFLEYAAGGSLVDHLRRHGRKFTETYLPQYTKLVLDLTLHYIFFKCLIYISFFIYMINLTFFSILIPIFSLISLI